MSGILFNRSKDLAGIVEFYTQKIGASIWLDQKQCIIMQHGNLLFSFCRSEKVDDLGCITFFYHSREEVDAMYEKLKDVATSEPKVNQQFNIYNFFAKDPEGRTIEFQVFNHHLRPFYTGDELLVLRRSVRDFTDEPVSDKLLNEVFDLCRYSPTSKNTEAFYFLTSRNKKLIERLAARKERGATPLVKAPVMAAVCTDPDKTIRPEEDACIAATYLMLAAAQFGLGTCWIGGMNTKAVKDILAIPEQYYIACLTPIGFPRKIDTQLPQRRTVAEFVKEI